MTEKLYYSDPSMMEFDARAVSVVERDGKCHAVLDRTCFYPGGGGQPCDTGTIAGVRVEETLPRDDEIVHVLSGPISEGAVHGVVDAEHRRDFMTQHTGEHVFAQALLRAGGLHTVSVHFGDDDTTIEVKADAVAPRVLRDAEDIANAAIRDNHRVVVHEIDRSELPRFALRRTPPDAQRLRIVEVGDYDRVACSGVHVSTTSELFLVKAAWQEKIRGNTRIHLMIGRRAFDDYGRKIALVQDLEKLLTCGEPFIRDRVQELMTRERETGRELKRLQLARASVDADEAVAAGKTVKGAVIVKRVLSDAGPDYVKAFVERVTATPGRLVIAIDRVGDGFQWTVAHSLADTFSLAAFLPALLPAADARGGGKPARMQGSGRSVAAADRFADAIEGAATVALEQEAL
ncbi:MAG TPA: alanyl-tRNA editing protein [Spirochaetia bacterium]